MLKQALLAAWSCLASGSLLLTPDTQQPLVGEEDAAPEAVSASFFSSLERFSRLVDIAYCVGSTGISPPFSCISRCSDFPSLDLVTTFHTGILLSDSCGYVAVDHGQPKAESSSQGNSTKAIIVAFRGTYSITNTIMDLSTVPQEYVPYPDPDDDDDGGGGGNDESTSEHQHKCTNCTVHMGFMESWRNARKLVLPAVKSALAQHPDYPIHLVGHSLGGAVAALAGLEMKAALRWDKIGITTFGEPRVGNQGLVDFIDKIFDMERDDGYDKDLEKRTYRRVTHVDDPVPLLPLTEWGYRAHGGEIFITKPDLAPAPEDLRICRGDKDMRCSAGAESDTRLKLGQLFFAHRDYFWRIGLCVPGGDPADWGRGRYNYTSRADEL